MTIDTRIVGILNLTPDSFSDGGAYPTLDTVLQAIEKLIAEGADVIDIGAESTRPGAAALSADEEWQRLEPLLKVLHKHKKSPVLFSLDTRHATSAAKALSYGIDWINDVSGFADSAMVEAVKSSDCKLVMMHSLSVPADKNIVLPDSVDVIQALHAFAAKRIHELAAAGIDPARIIFDPGIGFGKTAAQSMDILRSIREFDSLKVPLLVGHSRKSFLAGLSAHRDEATLIASQHLATQHVGYLRVHDVAAHTRMLKMLKALQHGK